MYSFDSVSLPFGPQGVPRCRPFRFRFPTLIGYLGPSARVPYPETWRKSGKDIPFNTGNTQQGECAKKRRVEFQESIDVLVLTVGRRVCPRMYRCVSCGTDGLQSIRVPSVKTCVLVVKSRCLRRRPWCGWDGVYVCIPCTPETRSLTVGSWLFRVRVLLPMCGCASVPEVTRTVLYHPRHLSVTWGTWVQVRGRRRLQGRRVHGSKDREVLMPRPYTRVA